MPTPTTLLLAHGFKFVAVTLVIATASLMGCTSETIGNAGQPASGAGNNDGNGANQNVSGGGSGSACVPNTGDGTSSCVDETCVAGEYCHVNGGISRCNIGCTTDSNCAAGQHCDLSNAKDSLGDKVGTCRSCNGTAPSTGTGTPPSPSASCGSFAGAYDFLPAAGSSSDCKSIIGNTGECAFAQTGCAMTQSCGSASGSVSFDINGSNFGKFSMTALQQGQTAKIDCTYQFSGTGTDRSVDMQCQLIGSKTLTCNFTGTLK